MSAAVRDDVISALRLLAAVVSATAAVALRAEEPSCPDEAGCAAPAVPPSAMSAGPVRGSFGGVLQVTFAHDDRAAQDAAATVCGLTGATASPLPPTVRWFRLPDAAEAVMACLRSDPAVLRVTQPL